MAQFVKHCPFLRQARHSLRTANNDQIKNLSNSMVPYRSFVSTAARSSWMDKFKTFFRGETPQQESTDSNSKMNIAEEKSEETGSSAMDKLKSSFNANKPQQPPGGFTLGRYADELKKARKLGKLAELFKGKVNEVTLSKAFERQESIIRVLATYDSSGENISSSHMAEAAKQCNCQVREVEDALSKYRLARQAETKINELKKEGKPLPTSLEELQKLLGPTSSVPANASVSTSKETTAKGNIAKGKVTSGNSDITKSTTASSNANMTKSTTASPNANTMKSKSTSATESTIKGQGTSLNAAATKGKVATVDASTPKGKVTPTSSSIATSKVTSAAKVPIPKYAVLNRNALCPCGSTKKFKRCCGRTQ